MPNSNIKQPQESMSNVICNIAPAMFSGALAYHGFNSSNALTATIGVGATCGLLWKFSTGKSFADSSEVISAAVSTAKLMYALKYDHPLNYGNGPGSLRPSNI